MLLGVCSIFFIKNKVCFDFKENEIWTFSFSVTGTYINQVETTLIAKGLMYNYLPKVLPGLVFDTEIGQNTKEYLPSKYLISRDLRFDANNINLKLTKTKDECLLDHGLLNRWTDIFFLPRTSWGLAFNPNNAAQTHSIFVKL